MEYSYVKNGIVKPKKHEILKLEKTRAEVKQRLQELESWMKQNIGHEKWMKVLNDYANISVKRDQIERKMAGMNQGQREALFYYENLHGGQIDANIIKG